jgi:hypothetical protein
MVLSSSFAFGSVTGHLPSEDALVDAPSSNKRWVAATRMQAYVRKILCQGRTWDRALFDLEDLLARRSQLSMCLVSLDRRTQWFAFRAQKVVLCEPHEPAIVDMRMPYNAHGSHCNTICKFCCKICMFVASMCRADGQSRNLISSHEHVRSYAHMCAGGRSQRIGRRRLGALGIGVH